MNDIQTIDVRPQSREEMPADQPPTAHDLVRIFRRHLWLVLLILVASTGTAAVISRRTPQAWRAAASMLLVQRAPFMAATPQAAATAPMMETLDTQISLLQSRALAQSAAARVGISPETLQSATTITTAREGDNVIDVAVEADSRQQAIAWADALCRTFVDYKKSVAQHNSQTALATLTGQAAQAKQQRETADAQVLAFRQNHHLNGIGLLDTNAQENAALQAVLSQDIVVSTARNDLGAAQAKASRLSAALQKANAAIKSGTGVRDDTQILKLQSDLNDEERARADKARKYKIAFPGLFGPLDAQIADTRARLNRAKQTLNSQPSLANQGSLQDASDAASADAATAQLRLTDAIQRRDVLQRQTTNLPELSMEADRLTQNADQAHTIYNSLSTAVRAAQLDQDVTSGNVQIVEPAYAPPAPVRPNHQRDMLVGLGVGVFLSLIAVLLREQSDRSVRAVSDVRRLANGPVVAVLPQMARVRGLPFSHGGAPPQMLETYNAARASLSLALHTGPAAGLDGHQVILVSSTLGGEGKSLTASELAQSFARAGRSVVLVNADMRRPSSLPLMRAGRGSKPGLSDVLSGKAAVLDCLVPTGVENLSILHSGVPSRNPIDLFSQSRTEETIKALRRVADVVIVDTPPAGVVADALLLAPYADRLLYVVAIGMADAESIQTTAAALASNSPNKLSYFINRAPQPRSVPSYYHDYYQPHPVPPGSHDHSPWRTLSLDREDLSQQDDAPQAAPPTDVQDAPAGAARAETATTSTPVGEETAVWTRPPIRVLPEIGSHLVALEGPYFGQKFALSPSRPLTIGILPDNDIVLARDGTISRRHARIAAEEGGYVVYDIGATNGTMVNDVQVTRQALRVGDMVQFGASRFRYE